MSLISKKVATQKSYFRTNETLSYSFRMEQLKKLKSTIKKYESEILEALKNDLNKSEAESYMTEIALVFDEINYFQRHLKRLMKKKRVAMSIAHLKSKSYVVYQPYGCVLIISPWNYPFQLSLVPLVGAISSGNCVVLKPSNYSPQTSAVIEKIVNECFDTRYIDVQQGGRDENQELLDQDFDYIFFTGNSDVGKYVMMKSAQKLIPVTLELGGKSPCIVDKSAKIDLSAKRIMWGKLINAGQTCVAVDYVYIHRSIKEDFIEACKKYAERFYGKDAIQNPEYPKIINEKHFNRLSRLIENENILYGGTVNRESCQIEPTIFECKDWDSPSMQMEIFGPLLPILTYDNLDGVIEEIQNKPSPLACYVFSENLEVTQNILETVKFGGGCVNDTLIHVGNNKLPFGGVGSSGLGRYHGKASFETFSYQKSIVTKSTLLDINLRYPPYKEKFRLLKKIMSWL